MTETDQNLIIKWELLQHRWVQLPLFVIRTPISVFSPTAKTVYAAILWRIRTEGDGTVFPSHETLAFDSGTSERTVRNTLQELRELGLVTWKRRGQGKTNLYYLERPSDDLLAHELQNGKRLPFWNGKHDPVLNGKRLPTNRSSEIEDVEVEDVPGAARTQNRNPLILVTLPDKDSGPTAQIPKVKRNGEVKKAMSDGDDLRSRLKRLNGVTQKQKLASYDARRGKEAKQAAKAAKVTVKKLDDPTKAAVFNSSSLWRYWRAQMVSILGVKESALGTKKWNMKQCKLANMLIESYGPQQVRDYVDWVLENWDALQSINPRLTDAMPNISILWGWRESWIPMVERGPVEKKGKIRGEYDEKSAAKSPKIGWGEL